MHGGAACLLSSLLSAGVVGTPTVATTTSAASASHSAQRPWLCLSALSAASVDGRPPAEPQEYVLHVARAVSSSSSVNSGVNSSNNNNNSSSSSSSSNRGDCDEQQQCAAWWMMAAASRGQAAAAHALVIRHTQTLRYPATLYVIIWNYPPYEHTTPL